MVMLLHMHESSPPLPLGLITNTRQLEIAHCPHFRLSETITMLQIKNNDKHAPKVLESVVWTADVHHNE